MGIVQRRLRTPTGGVFAKLLYRWHPWFGIQVFIHEVIEKSDGAVFRCTLSGSDADRWLEVPAWMFDHAVCTGQAASAHAFVDIVAIGADEYQPVEDVEAEPPRRGAPKDDDLLPKDQNLGVK